MSTERSAAARRYKVRFLGAMAVYSKRRVQFEAVCIAAVLTCLSTFAWGLLEIAGLPKMPVVLVMPLFCAINGIAAVLATRKFR